MPTAQNKTKPTKTSVPSYINALPDPKRRADCQDLVVMMRQATGDKPVMWGTSLVGFGYIVQTSAAGRTVDWMKMGFASRKTALSLYLTCDLDRFAADLKNLGPHKRGVGCLYIKRLDDINRSVLEKMIRKAASLA